MTTDIISTARSAGVHPLAITGLTIRDYFAAAVAQGIWANANVLSRLTKGNQAQDIAAVVYEQADAMLKERSE